MLLIVCRVNGMPDNTATNAVLSSIFGCMFYLGYVCLQSFFSFFLFYFVRRHDMVATGQEMVRENKNSLRSGKSQGILFWVRENWHFEEKSGKIED